MNERHAFRPAALLVASLFVLSAAAIGCSDNSEQSVRAWDPGCEDLVDDAGSGTMDSVGIAIVVSASPAWDDNDALLLGATPVLRIGVTRGDRAYEFGRISAVTRMTDGRIVVGDGQSAQVSVFDEAGRFLRTVGGKGDGPGEFRTISAIVRSAGDTLWMYDRGSRRLTKLSPELAVIETIPLTPVSWTVPATTPGGRSSSGRTPLRLKGILADGSIIASNSLRTLRTEEITNVSRDSLILRRVRAGREETDSLGLLLGIQHFEFFAPDGSVTFGEALLGYVESLAVAHDRYYYGSAERFEIEEHAPDGRLVRLIRLCEEPEAIDDARLQSIIAQRLATFSPAALEYEEPALRGIPKPTVAPSFLQMHVDGADRLWVRDFTYPGESQRWKVFDSEGRWLGEVETPADLEVVEIGADYLLGLHTNELDVQSVRMYGLDQPRAGGSARTGGAGG